jgi:homoserine O-acetyltransferase
MKGIKSKMLVLPGKTDLYFPPEDSATEVENMRLGIGKMVEFPSIWGHWAGGPGDSKEDHVWLNDRLREVLEEKEEKQGRGEEQDLEAKFQKVEI